MPRFIPDKWKPEHDSSPGVSHLDPGAVVLYVPRVEGRGACPCGCGEFPEGTKATFRMGHDARLRGILIRAHLMDVGILIIADPDDSGFWSGHAAMEVAEWHNWGPYLESAVLKREGKNRELLQRALNSPELLKAGRWDYTGGQVVILYKPNPRTNMMDIEYVNRAGEIRKSRVPASEAPLASEEQ